MTPNADAPNEEQVPRARRRWTSRMPIWVRVSAIVTALLVGVLLSTVLLAAGGVGDSRSGSGGGHGSGGEIQMDDDGSRRGHGIDGEHDTGSDRSSRVDHGSDADHNPGGDRG